MLLGPKVLETGIIFPAGSGKTAFTLRKDMTEATADILITDGHNNKSYYFSANENISFEEIAGLLTEITGKTVNYLNLTPLQFISKMVEAGVPEQQAQALAAYGEGISKGEQESTRSDLEVLLGRKPASIKEFLISQYSK